MGHLKLKEGTSFPLNLSVGEIRDISKRKGTFSKTITLVGDDDNNNLLNHYYDVNIEAGTFDVNKLQECQIIQNGIVILDNAYMQLVEVVKSQSTDAHNQKIEYKVLVKDSVSDFFTKLGNKTLNDINIEEIVTSGTPIVYTSANVVGSFNNTIADGFKFVLPLDVDDDSAYNLKAFHPAIYTKLYFDAIFQGAGFTYEWGNQSPGDHTTNDNYFEKLLIPYNGGTPKQNRNDYLVEATKAGLTTSQSGFNWIEQITGFTEVTDLENLFDPANGDYAVPFNIQNPENVQVQVTIDYDLDLVNNDFATYPNAYAVQTGFLRHRVAVKKQGTGAGVFSDFNQFYNQQKPNTLTTATTNIVSGGTFTVTLNASNLLNTDILEFYILGAGSVGLAGTYKSAPSGGVNLSVDADITINSSTWEIIPSSDTIGFNSNLNLNVYVPNKVKQSDFIKSIFMMYNLYAEVDKSQPNKIILQSRDDYYDSGSEIDWTYKLAKDKDQTLQFLPELTAKKMLLSYKDDDDDINKVYKEATNETYGQVEYTFENEYVKGIDRKEIIFSPTPIVKTPFNAYIPALGYIPEVNIRILVDGGTQSCDEFDIYDYYSGSTGVGQLAQTTAPLITHFDDPVTPSFDLNWATCDFYFYSDLAQKTNNNLYNLYWRRTLGQIDKGKMLVAFFDLKEVDIQTLKLNDKIRIDNSWWHINRVIDYDANEHKLTKVELISVDEEIEFTPFATTSVIPIDPNLPSNPNPIKPTKPEIIRPIKDILKKNNEAKNLYTGDVDVKGRNNQIGSDVKKAIVIGNNQTVEEDGIHTEKLFINGSDVQGNFATNNLELTDNRTHVLNGNFLWIDQDGTGTAQFIYIDTNSSIIGYGNNLFEAGSTYIKIQFGAGGNALVVTSGVISLNDAKGFDTRIKGFTDNNLLYADESTDRIGIGTNVPQEKLHVVDIVRSDIGFNVNGTTGLSGTYTFGGGSSGDVSSMTFVGGILTAVTTIP